MKRLFKIYLDRPELAGIVLLALLVALFEITSGGFFLSYENMRGVLGLLPEVALVAIGVTILMIAGEFDISVGSVFALAPMVMAVSMGAGVPFAPAVLLGLAAAAVVGYLNGFITLRFAIPSFITTLGMLFVARSLTVVISGGFPPVLPSDIPSWIFTLYVGLIRLSMFWFAGIAVALAAILSLTNFGNWIKSTGGQIEAAAAMGIPTDAVKMICFVLSAVLAGFAGIIQVLRLGSPLPSLGEGLELQAIAAAVIGGTSLYGGVGTVLGAIVGALLIRVIDNGLVLSHVDANWFKFAIGSLLILAVVANAWLRRTSRRIKMETLMDAPLIETKGLHKWYSGVHALKNVDFQVFKGEVVGLVGDNGAGKTTLIKILSGVHPPDEGAILIEGRKVDIATPKQAMKLGIETIYQTNSMVPTMSIARNLFAGREPLRVVGFWLRLHGSGADAPRQRQGDRRRGPASALARCAGRRTLRRPAAGRGNRACDVFQVEGFDPRRADQPALGQGDQQGHRFRQGAEETRRHRHLHQPQHASRVPVLRPGGGDGARRDRLQQADRGNDDRGSARLSVRTG